MVNAKEELGAVGIACKAHDIGSKGLSRQVGSSMVTQCTNEVSHLVGQLHDRLGTCILWLSLYSFSRGTLSWGNNALQYCLQLVELLLGEHCLFLTCLRSLLGSKVVLNGGLVLLLVRVNDLLPLLVGQGILLGLGHESELLQHSL